MEFGELLKTFLLDLQSLFRANITNKNLTLAQTLLISSIPDEGIDMTSLSRQIGVENSTLTRLVDVLIKNQWVTKKQSQRDKRSYKVHLTDKGEAIQQKIEGKIDIFGEALFHEIPFEDREETKEILNSFHWIVSKSRLKR